MGGRGCFPLAPPPGTFEASHSPPFCHAQSQTVKVMQTNMVSQHFILRVLCFRSSRGSFRPTAPSRLGQAPG